MAVSPQPICHSTSEVLHWEVWEILFIHPSYTEPFLDTGIQAVSQPWHLKYKSPVKTRATSKVQGHSRSTSNHREWLKVTIWILKHTTSNQVSCTEKTKWDPPFFMSKLIMRGKQRHIKYSVYSCEKPLCIKHLFGSDLIFINGHLDLFF